jgi:hypothetical protein
MPRIIKSAQGTFTTSTITVDADGRVISAESGTAGGGMFTPKVVEAGPASGTFTTSGSFVGAYLYAGGGGGGGGGFGPAPGAPGGSGGKGGFGYFGAPVTAPFSQPYTIGGGGSGGNGNTQSQGSTGSTGGDTTLATVGTVTGGAGGTGGQNNGITGSTGSTGAAPGADLTPPASVRTLVSGTDFGTGGNGGTGGRPGLNTAGSGTTGNAGAVVIFDNTGS